MKKRLSLILLSLFISASAYAQVKIGYMNPAEVLTQLDEVATIEEQVQALVEQRDQELIARSTQLQQDFITYEEGKSVLSADARTTKEQELMDRNAQLEEDRETYLNEIRQRRAQLMEPVLAKMDAAISSIAQEMGLDLVLNEGTSYGDAIVFYANSESLNITAQVLARLKGE